MKYLLFYCSIWVFISAEKEGCRKLFVIGLVPLWRIRGRVCIEIQIGNSSEENEGYKMWNNYTCRIFWQIYRCKNRAVITGEVGCREMHCCIKIALKKIKGECIIFVHQLITARYFDDEVYKKNHTRNLWHYKEMLLQGKDLKIEYIFDPNKTKKTVFYLFQLLRWVI